MIGKANNIVALGMTLRRMSLSVHHYPSFRESSESFGFSLALLGFKLLPTTLDDYFDL